MEIVLMRHGRPGIDLGQRSSPAGFRDFMTAYDLAKLDRSRPPPTVATEVAAECAVVVCSDLSRSVESAALLGHSQVHLRDEMFREVLMPYAPLSFPRLSVVSWVFIFRILQLLGYSMGAESFVAATNRAAHCTRRLIELGEGHQRVLLVGHGAMNYLIARRLTQLGWIGTGARRQRHWNFMRFTRP